MSKLGAEVNTLRHILRGGFRLGQQAKLKC